jgi:hypothetical protein
LEIPIWRGLGFIEIEIAPLPPGYTNTGYLHVLDKRGESIFFFGFSNEVVPYCTKFVNKHAGLYYTYQSNSYMIAVARKNSLIDNIFTLGIEIIPTGTWLCVRSGVWARIQGPFYNHTT